MLSQLTLVVLHEGAEHQDPQYRNANATQAHAVPDLLLDGIPPPLWKATLPPAPVITASFSGHRDLVAHWEVVDQLQFNRQKPARVDERPKQFWLLDDCHQLLLALVLSRMLHWILTKACYSSRAHVTVGIMPCLFRRCERLEEVQPMQGLQPSAVSSSLFIALLLRQLPALCPTKLFAALLTVFFFISFCCANYCFLSNHYYMLLHTHLCFSF